ncbi:MAG: S1/P1 nuclease [Rhodocyclaceae bacterium]
MSHCDAGDKGLALRLARGMLIPLLLFLPLSASAWNAAGHRLGALIAWQQLDDATREKIGAILAQHPDHERWIARARGNPPELAAFLGASTWPDDIKADKRFYDAGQDAETPLLPGFPDMARHRHWHYLDKPLGHPPKHEDSDGELDRQLERLSDTLRNSSSDNRQRVYALPWLIHLVADAHQPLHTVSRYDAAGKSDRGGNRLLVTNPFHPRRASMSLHGYWDDLAGPPWLHGHYLEEAAARITASHPQAPRRSATKRWIAESWQIARDSAYPPENDTAMPVLLDGDFHQKAQEIAQRRIAESGYRLAALLRNLLRSKP